MARVWDGEAMSRGRRQQKFPLTCDMFTAKWQGIIYSCRTKPGLAWWGYI